MNSHPSWASPTSERHKFRCHVCQKTLTFRKRRDFLRHEASRGHRNTAVGGIANEPSECADSDAETDEEQSMKEGRLNIVDAAHRLVLEDDEIGQDYNMTAATPDNSPATSDLDTDSREHFMRSTPPSSPLHCFPSPSGIQSFSPQLSSPPRPAIDSPSNRIPGVECRASGKTGRNPTRPFASGLDLRLILARCALALVFSRSQFQLIYLLVKYAKEHPDDHLSSFDSLWNRVMDRIPEQIMAPVISTPIATKSGDRKFYHIALAPCMRHVVGSPVLSSELKFLPQINTQGGLSNLCQANKWHTDPYCQVINVRRPDGVLLWVQDFHDLYSGGKYLGIVQLVQFLVLDTGELLARVHKVVSRDTGLTYLVDVSQTYDVLAEDIQCLRRPITSSAPAAICVDPRSFRIVGFVDWGPGNTHLIVSERVNETELIRLFIAPHPLREMSCGKRHIVMPRVIFTDEFSGSRSKRFDYYENFSVTFAGLGYHANNHLANQFFIAAARPPIEVLQMAEAHQRTSGRVAEEGIFAWHHAFSEEVFLTSHIYHVSADNPRINKVSVHLFVQVAANLNDFQFGFVPVVHLGKVTGTRKTVTGKNCRNCLVDASTGWLLGPPRTKAEMKRIIEESRVIRASKPSRGKLQPNQLRAGKGNADKHLKSVGLVDDREDGNVLDNVFLDAPGYDPYMDSDTELLHWDLGLPKQNCLDGREFLSSKESKQQMVAVFDSLNLRGLPNTVDGNRAASLVGSMVSKDYKVMSQIAPYAYMWFTYFIRHLKRSTKTLTTAPKITSKKGHSSRRSDSEDDVDMGNPDGETDNDDERQ
ncbi:hypothetical protein HDU93_002043, partial [Gonapodya sp. JEL0774]